ncbi:MAG TPA: nuclear transport factor 2 family protein [Reyranella sp.]|nr:nuclear transport factor 2 family protein [Reyranella sp.]
MRAVHMNVESGSRQRVIVASTIDAGMTDIEIHDFITRFAAAWASRDGEAFLALWHPDGVLHSPLYDRPVRGKALGRLTEIVTERAPDSVWQLLDWTARGDTVIVEWQNTRTAGGRRSDWRGVDKFRLRDGKITEERVYMDTAPLRAVAEGLTLSPVIVLPA